MIDDDDIAELERENRMQAARNRRLDELVKELQESEEPLKASDFQVAGDHYKRLTPEPWDVMEGWNREHFIGFLRYSALKRLGRWDSKDGALQDVTKAIHELTKLKEILEAGQ